MKKLIVAFAALVLLAGCTTDDYTALPSATVQQKDAKADAKACRESASETYLWDQGHAWTVLLAVAGAAAGGAVGGAVAGGAVASHSVPPTLDQMIEACMKERGYVGVSHAF